MDENAGVSTPKRSHRSSPHVLEARTPNAKVNVVPTAAERMRAAFAKPLPKNGTATKSPRKAAAAEANRRAETIIAEERARVAKSTRGEGPATRMKHDIEMLKQRRLELERKHQEVLSGVGRSNARSTSSAPPPPAAATMPPPPPSTTKTAAPAARSPTGFDREQIERDLKQKIRATLQEAGERARKEFHAKEAAKKKHSSSSAAERDADERNRREAAAVMDRLERERAAAEPSSRAASKSSWSSTSSKTSSSSSSVPAGASEDLIAAAVAVKTARSQVERIAVTVELHRKALARSEADHAKALADLKRRDAEYARQMKKDSARRKEQTIFDTKLKEIKAAVREKAAKEKAAREAARKEADATAARKRAAEAAREKQARAARQEKAEAAAASKRAAGESQRSEAESCKKKGNDHYHEQRYEDAAAQYTKAVQIAERLHDAHSTAVRVFYLFILHLTTPLL